MTTGFLPLHATDHLYFDTVEVVCLLLRADVSSIPETAGYLADLASMEIGASGSYTPGTGVVMPDLTTVEDAASGTVEYSVGSSTYTDGGSHTLSFRWAVFISRTGSPILAAFDFGSSQTLTAEPLSFTVAASPYIAGSYPILRFRK